MPYGWPHARPSPKIENNSMTEDSETLTLPPPLQCRLTPETYLARGCGPGPRRTPGEVRRAICASKSREG